MSSISISKHSSRSSDASSTVDSFEDEAVVTRAVPATNNMPHGPPHNHVDLEEPMTSSFKTTTATTGGTTSYRPVAMAEQPSNPPVKPPAMMMLGNVAPRDNNNGENNNKSQPLCCGILSLRHCCCMCGRLLALLTIIGLSIGAGILIGKSLSESDGCVLEPGTVIEPAKDIVAGTSPPTASDTTASPPPRDVVDWAPVIGGDENAPNQTNSPGIATSAPTPTTTPPGTSLRPTSAAVLAPTFAPTLPFTGTIPPQEVVDPWFPPESGGGMAPPFGTYPPQPVTDPWFPGSGTDSDGCDDGGQHWFNDPATAIDLGHYGGSASCRYSFVSCEATSWSPFMIHKGTNTQWFRATASENSSCQANVEHKIRLTVPEGVDHDLYIYKSSTGSGTSDFGTTIVAGEPYMSSNNGMGMDEELLVSSEDNILVNDCFDYYIMVEYRSGSTCESWTLEVFGHDCWDM